MLKRVIFDLDDTLIDWKEDYWHKGIIYACEKLKVRYNKELEEKIIEAINEYEKDENYFNIEKMQGIINKKINMKLSTSFIKAILKYFEICVPEQMNVNIVETLDYLVNKYELVVLTNWFENQQIQRLKNAGIYKYFKQVYGTENIKMKPDKEAYLTAIGKFSLDECVMVGDDLKIDIDGALGIGLNAIFLNRKNINVDKKYTVITSLDELIKIL